MGGAASVDDLRPGDHACLTYSDAEELLDIVAAFVRDGPLDGDIHVNLAHLTFMDAAAAAAIGQAALGLQPGRVMAVVCRRAVREVLGLVGVTEQPAVRVRLAHARP